MSSTTSFPDRNSPINPAGAPSTEAAAETPKKDGLKHRASIVSSVATAVTGTSTGTDSHVQGKMHSPPPSNGSTPSPSVTTCVNVAKQIAKQEKTSYAARIEDVKKKTSEVKKLGDCESIKELDSEVDKLAGEIQWVAKELKTIQEKNAAFGSKLKGVFSPAKKKDREVYQKALKGYLREMVNSANSFEKPSLTLKSNIGLIGNQLNEQVKTYNDLESVSKKLDKAMEPLWDRSLQHGPLLVFFEHNDRLNDFNIREYINR